MVDHLDGNAANNDPENLAPSCTIDNVARIKGNFRTSFNEDDIEAILALEKCGRLTREEIAKIFGVKAVTIGRVVNGTWGVCCGS